MPLLGEIPFKVLFKERYDDRQLFLLQNGHLFMSCLGVLYIIGAFSILLELKKLVEFVCTLVNKKRATMPKEMHLLLGQLDRKFSTGAMHPILFSLGTLIHNILILIR